mmetsp:Transcript_30436/g.26845  ORF Transcript_30436/g.26845 Transcript_30436/m.26845 type:complete len:105 (+) Transcript_30436:2-316(+)
MNAKAVLQQMGINDAFNKYKADFSDITGNKELYISNVIHKAIIEVDEDGTEAAAATVIHSFYDTCIKRSRAPPPTIRFDHPFTFYIYDEERDITLFSGRFVGKG